MRARPPLLAKRARAAGCAVTLSAHGKSADVRSLTAVMALGAAHGDELTITARAGQRAGRSSTRWLAGWKKPCSWSARAGGDALALARRAQWRTGPPRRTLQARFARA